MQQLLRPNLSTILWILFFFSMNTPSSNSELVFHQTTQAVVETPPPVEKTKPKIKKKKKLKKRLFKKQQKKQAHPNAIDKKDNIGVLVLWVSLFLGLLLMLIGALVFGLGALYLAAVIIGLIFLGLGTILTGFIGIIGIVDRPIITVLGLGAILITGAAFLIAGLLMSLSIFWIVGIIMLSIFLLCLILAIIFLTDH